MAKARIHAHLKRACILLICLSISLSAFSINIAYAQEILHYQLWVNYFSNDLMEWNISQGTNPYLNESGSGKIYEKSLDSCYAEYFGFENLPPIANFNLINASLCTYIDFDYGNLYYRPYLWNGSYVQVGNVSNSEGDNEYLNLTVTATFTDVASINNVRLKINAHFGVIGYYIYIFRAFLNIFLTGQVGYAEITINIIEDGLQCSEPLHALRLGSSYLKNNDTAIKELGIHTLTYVANMHNFLNWSVTGGLSVNNASESSTYLNITDNGVLTLQMESKIDLTNLYTWIVQFLAALFLMIWSPSWFAWKIKKVGVTVESIERLGYAMLLFLVGFGLLVMCLYA